MMSCRHSKVFLQAWTLCFAGLLLQFPLIPVFNSQALARPQAGGVSAAGPKARMV